MGRIAYQTALVTILGGAVLGSTLAIRRDYTFFDPLIDIKTVIGQQYFEKPDEKAMQLGAINGMVGALNDPYTVYVPQADTREFNKELTGDYVGIGVQITVRDGWLTVVTPLEDTPAFKLGVMADDRVVEVDGKSTFGLTSDQCVELLSGRPGEPVAIVIERGTERIPLTIVRERIVTRTVKGVHWDQATVEGSARWRYTIDPARRIAYIRLTQFTPTCAVEIAETLRAEGAARGELGGLVLDLRWNPGGVLDDAVSIADLFLADGVIVSTKGRAHAERVVRAVKDGTLPDFPVALIINGQSASASEVLAGALVESNRAIAVGTRTFGKGLVQNVIELPSGGQLKVTEQRYYLPSGRCIQRSDESAEWGVDPTAGFYVPITDDELVALAKVRREEEIIRSAPGTAEDQDWSNPDWILERLKDKQLAAAVRAVQLRVDTGAWTPTGQAAPTGAEVAAGELTQTEKFRDRLLKELERIDERIEALQTAAGPIPRRTRPDLWADELDLTGGAVEVRDKDGKVVTVLRITGPDLEEWLRDADVAPEQAPQ